jgi:DNA polymerase-3 subunit delta
VPAFKTAYLIHGDDHGRIGERRHRLRELAEGESGVNGVELFEGEAAAPEAVANALLAMTFAMGRRFVIVEGVERWKDSEVADTIAPAMAAMGDDTTVAFFAREEGRFKAPAKLAEAVKKAGGDIAAEMTLKAKDLPRWLIGEATKLGVELDGAGAHALVAHVGERQQRLLRELETLALEHGVAGKQIRLGVEEVEEVAADSAERQVWGFVDALVARDTRNATRRFLELRAQGEAMPRLIPLMARRLREVLGIAARLHEGESPAQVKATTKGNPWALDQRIKEARNADPDVLRAALVALADLELDTRGGSELDDDTVGLRAIAAITA